MKQLKESLLDSNFDINDPIIDPKLWSNFKNPMVFQHIVFGAIDTNKLIMSHEFIDRFNKFLEGFKTELEKLGVDPDTVLSSDAQKKGLSNILNTVPDEKQFKLVQKDVDEQTELLKGCTEVDDFMYDLLKNDWKKIRGEAHPMSKKFGYTDDGFLLTILGSRENNKELEDLISSNNYETKSFKVEPAFAGRQTNIAFVKK